MSNMSYCRFQNTSGDVVECLDALNEQKPLSSDEYHAAVGMFDAILFFCQEVGIIENFDRGRIRECLSELRIKKE